ncbi:kinase-like protein [Athelia psychrophila]|uniref:Kinase-like protein n=1 Tax=Athelia psychrophila TaxID=1759441 RepID=A0A166J7B7_9AGAM|nr:kinase-like protein [Fibularhizoctonia sp. CBS 109695]
MLVDTGIMPPQEPDDVAQHMSPTTPSPFGLGRTWPQPIDDELIRREEANEHCFAYGDVAQLWKREMKSSGRLVAIKGFRTTSKDIDNINRRFEVALHGLVRSWQKLDHQNIMPCLGVALDFGLVVSLVMPMCPDGSINQYVEENPNTNKLDLLSQVAGGVTYLHSQGIVHGKICGRNIVIAPNGRPLITDTGLSQIIQAHEGIFPWELPSESMRWMAPELFASELDDACTTSSDVWALAMTILEVMSGHIPYYPRGPHVAGVAIMKGVLPERPDDDSVSDDLWGALNMLWMGNRESRPCASFVQWQLDALRNDTSYHLYKL